MTSDSTLLHRPTEALILPTKRRFFPFKIPNFHPQLRHYISTADPDRIYVIVEKIVYSIHIASQKRESIAVIPFEPRCLAAGYGWIGVGGPEIGECAIIRLADNSMSVSSDAPSFQPSDIDSALPLDLEPPSRVSPGTSNGSSLLARRPLQPQLPAVVEIHNFGSQIVNSVTIHRFPGDSEGFANEDVMIFSNNDKTITIYSLARAKVLKVLHHPNCMNYAIISPDSRLLAAVGDENRAHFYRITRDLDSTVTTESGEKLPGREWDLARCVEMDIGLRSDDACCFTIAFSPSSHLCAIGSQSGIITVFDVGVIHKTGGEPENDSPIVCQFPASRSCSEGGAVRCMTFSPEPWDLLVWLEAHGRAGVADVRQAFLRRQILHLDIDDPDLQEVHTEPLAEDIEGQILEDEGIGSTSRSRLDRLDTAEDSWNEQGGEDSERSSLRETLIQDLTERERLVMEFLNTTRWTSRLEEGLTERPERPARASIHPHPAARTRLHGSTDAVSRSSRPTSPLHSYDIPRETSRDNNSGRTGANDRSVNARRQSSMVLSQGSRYREAGTSHHERHPNIALSLTTSPSEMQSSGSDSTSRAAEYEYDSASHESGRSIRPPDTTGPSLSAFEFGMSPEAVSRLRSQRSSSTPRRAERPQAGPERRYDTSRLSNYEIRANVAAERLRRQRQIAIEVHNRSFEREQRRQQLGFEQTHSPRWIRNIINDLPDRRSMMRGIGGVEEPDSTAGVGFGGDGRTLYIATVEGIFEFHLNVHDRKTFPIFSCR